LIDKTLGVEPGHPEVLQAPPRRRETGIVYRGMLYRLLFTAAVMTIGTLGLFSWALTTGDQTFARTVAFTALAAFQWANAFNARSTTTSVFKLGFFRNRWLIAGVAASFLLQLVVVEVGALEVIFGTVSLGLPGWLLILGAAATLFVVEEIRKAVAPTLFTEGRR
jgi:Ca2+-transporting ATPase